MTHGGDSDICPRESGGDSLRFGESELLDRGDPEVVRRGESFTRGHSLAFVAGELEPLERGESVPFERFLLALDRGDSLPLRRGDSLPQGRGESLLLLLGDPDDLLWRTRRLSSSQVVGELLKVFIVNIPSTTKLSVPNCECKVAK